MVQTTWLIFSIIILLAVVAVAVFLLTKKKKRLPDYYIFFVVGLMWLVLGFPIGNYLLSAMGAIFVIIGLANKDKWQTNHPTWDKLSQQEKKLKIGLIIFLSLMIIVGLAIYFLNFRTI